MPWENAVEEIIKSANWNAQQKTEMFALGGHQATVWGVEAITLDVGA